MSKSGWKALGFAAVLLALLWAPGRAKAQSSQTGATETAPRDTTPFPATEGPPDPEHIRLEQQRRHLIEDERHKRLLADTDRLLQLATDLKQEVDKANKNELSLDVIKKAAEVEKLAHDVKERMKQ